MDINGRVAVVTGAGSGIGLATALRLAAGGCHLALVDLDLDRLVAAQQVALHRGITASVHVADVSDGQRMAQLPDEVLKHHGGCSIVVNNAGVLSMGRFADERLEDIRWIVDVNVFGVVHGCHYFLPLLQKSDAAHIVNVSSLAAFAGMPQGAAYAMTKGAVRSLTESLRAELVDTPIGVTTVFPGGTRTNLMRGARGSRAAWGARYADARFASLLSRAPDAVARQIVKAVQRDRARVVVGPDAWGLDLAARLLPGRTGLMGRAVNRILG